MSTEIIAPVVDELEVIGEGINRVRDCPNKEEHESCRAQSEEQRAEDIGAHARKVDVFEQFERFFRGKLFSGDGATEEQLNVHGDQSNDLSGRAFPERDVSRRVQETRWLWEGDILANGTNVWDHEEIPRMDHGWERILRNTSIVRGVEDWVRKLEVPEVPDNRVKLIFASICAERKKTEMCNRIQESLLQTDSELCPVVVQMRVNETLERIRLVKYSVETIEDVLILLSKTSVEPKQRDSLVEKLAETIHGDTMTELMRFSYARNLLVVSLGVLLDSNFRRHAFEVLRILISGVVRDDAASRSHERKSLLAGILGRCTPTESMWLREEFLALHSKDKENPLSDGCADITEVLLKGNDSKSRLDSDCHRVARGSFKGLRTEKESFPKNGGRS